MVVPEVSPELMHDGKVSSRALDWLVPKEHRKTGYNPRQLLAYIPVPTT